MYDSEKIPSEPASSSLHEGKSSGASVLHLAVVCGLASLCICYVAGVNGNSALIVFSGVVLFILIAGTLLLTAGSRSEREAFEAAQNASAPQVEKTPQEYSGRILLGDSLLVRFSISGSPKPVDDPPKLRFEKP